MRRGLLGLLGLHGSKLACLPLALVSVLACGGSGSDDDGSESSESSESSEAGSSASESDGGESSTETETETETGDTGEPGNPLLSGEFLVIAHRGGGRLRPEATLVAFENALAVGAQVLEFDVHQSADDVMVILHDDTVDRTTEGSGEVAQMSFDELRALDAGYWFSPDGGRTYPYRGMGVQIPTPEEVFESFPDQVYLIEIKPQESTIPAQLVEAIQAHGVEERVVIASFHQAVIDEVRALGPELETAFTLAEMVEFQANAEEPDYAPPARFVQPPWDLVTLGLVELAHGHGLELHPWTVNDADTMTMLIELGVDGIMTDDPALLAEVAGG